MADSKISALPPAATLTGAELIAVVQSGNSVRSTVGATGNNALGTYTPPGVGAIARTVSSKLAETVSVGDYGGVPPTYPNVVFFDGSTSRALIGQGFSGTNIWSANGSATSRLQEFASCFQYTAAGGGTFGDDTNFGVALYSAAQLTGGSRAIYGLNSVVLVSNTAGSGGNAGKLQAAAIGIEIDVVNNSNLDANLSASPWLSTAYDQFLGLRVGSTGNKRPQQGLQTFSSLGANRWQSGAGLYNWQQFGLQIVQDPANVPNAGSAAVTGPCIQLQASSPGGNPIFQIMNAGLTQVFAITQAGELQHPNNVPLQFFDSAGSPQNCLTVDSSNTTRLQCSPTGSGLGFLLDSAGAVKFSWNATGFAFMSGTPVAQPAGYGTPTGNAYQPSFAAGSITLPNLAAAVAQLIIDLKVGKLGLLGV